MSSASFRIKSLLALGLALGVILTHGCDGDYCQNVDFGACGNACCKLEWVIHLPAEEVMSALNASLHSFGPDGLYKASALAHGGSGFKPSNPVLPNPPYCMGQGTHTTKVDDYVDTLNFAIYSPSPERTTITAFSISNVGAALSDQGQNYSNLEELLQALGFKFEENIVMGCGSLGFETSSSLKLGLVMGAQFFFLLVPIFQMQSFFSVQVVRYLCRASNIMAFIMLSALASLPTAEARDALPLFIVNLSLRVIEPIFFFATSGDGLKILMGFPTASTNYQQYSGIDMVQGST